MTAWSTGKTFKLLEIQNKVWSSHQLWSSEWCHFLHDLGQRPGRCGWPQEEGFPGCWCGRMTAWTLGGCRCHPAQSTSPSSCSKVAERCCHEPGLEIGTERKDTEASSPVLFKLFTKIFKCLTPTGFIISTDVLNNKCLILLACSLDPFFYFSLAYFK